MLKSGKADSGKIRYRKTQLLLLDGLLAANDGSTVDTAFDTARQQLAGFRSIVREDPRGEFHGELRPYQAEGLGWMAFLRQFGFGGCLADDMGLGKTVQVLAALESRRDSAGAERRTSLAVVPRSLVFNWKRETARFAPRLRVLDATGPARSSGLERLGEYDLVLSTYGTLRRDASVLKDFQFDYVILDEAHQIKNASSLAARAARLLRSDHRLALTGTPIENRTSELWSLFEFLNPGFLGSAKVFRENAHRDSTVGADSLAPLRHALRPFILRRTKAQVAPELPERSENTIWCELSDDERKRYDELRDYYRASVLGAIDKAGLRDCRFQVLEALLRLRQACCHAGLIDKHRAKDGSAKLDALLGRLEELGEEGHKAIVFSQFTSFLAIVKDRLVERGVVHEYLDGKTCDRESRVKSFQEDPRVKLFLVSLKAGGVGLNLTAAEYVFLLDPWWNPAAEAQAIDRAHRIGQKRRVFAYRLVARNTVEEKVIELQSRKRALADAIISGENASLADLTREDLEVLLS